MPYYQSFNFTAYYVAVYKFKVVSFYATYILGNYVTNSLEYMQCSDKYIILLCFVWEDQSKAAFCTGHRISYAKNYFINYVL